MVTIVIPTCIVLATPDSLGWRLSAAIAWLPLTVGCALVGLGLVLMGRTIRLFAVVGKGTLAPWDPPRRFVVRGPYRHVRNPMISGVLFVVLGEAIALGSLPLVAWFVVFLAINATYIPLYEEPRLLRRFGDDYAEYRRHVRRWLPRVVAWGGPSGR